jgi:hypothetical protein
MKSAAIEDLPVVSEWGMSKDDLRDQKTIQHHQITLSCQPLILWNIELFLKSPVLFT